MRLLAAASCLGLISAIACDGADAPIPGADDDFVPARELSLAELAGSRPPVDSTVVTRQPRPSASPLRAIP